MSVEEHLLPDAKRVLPGLGFATLVVTMAVLILAAVSIPLMWETQSDTDAVPVGAVPTSFWPEVSFTGGQIIPPPGRRVQARLVDRGGEYPVYQRADFRICLLFGTTRQFGTHY